MKIFLSSLDTTGGIKLVNKLPLMIYNLLSYYYIKKMSKEKYDLIYNKTNLLMIDSGAHSFQKGKKVEWDKYTKEYANWIKENDSDKIIGYFEMDVDNVLGYKKVLELRKILNNVSDKIIPVWHKNRGIEDYIKMCKKYKGKIIAITGFKNEDITDNQYEMFLNVAWDHGCRVHCLGMTRKKILDKIPFDYTDSASWTTPARYGTLYNRRVKRAPGNAVCTHNLSYRESMKMQKYYEDKWKNYENEYKRGL